MMEKRILGNTDIEITPVGLGCMGLSNAFGTPLKKDEAAEKIQNNIGRNSLAARFALCSATSWVNGWAGA